MTLTSAADKTLKPIRVMVLVIRYFISTKQTISCTSISCQVTTYIPLIMHNAMKPEKRWHSPLAAILLATVSRIICSECEQSSLAVVQQSHGLRRMKSRA